MALTKPPATRFVARTEKAASMSLRELTEDELAKLAEHQLWLDSKGASGNQAQFEGHDFTHVNLQNRNMQRANLSGTNCTDASLGNADLTATTLVGANLRNADLRAAVLRDADLTRVTNLLPVQLAGADLRGAALPQGLQEFKGLKQVEDAADYSRKLFLGVLAGCAYSWLTIATTTDVRLITNTASSPLPFVGAQVPIAGFYIAAPLILFAAYLYFHLNLLRLWEQLADLPAILPDGRTLDKVADPWLLLGLIRSHVKHLRISRPPLSHLQSALSWLTAWWVVPFTIGWFWLRYLTRQAWWGTLLQITLLVASIFLAWYFEFMARKTLREKGCMQSKNEVPAVAAAGGVALLLGLLFFLLSAGVISVVEGSPSAVKAVARGIGMREPPTRSMVLFVRRLVDPFSKPDERIAPSDHPHDPQSWVPQFLKFCGASPYADLHQADVSAKPPNWSGDEKQVPQVMGARLEGSSLRFSNGYGVFLTNANLKGADLTGATLDSADLRGASLISADLTQADLESAFLMDALFAEADLAEADLKWSDLTGAHLHGADLRGANLMSAKLGRADLSFAKLMGADLRKAQLERANLLLADLTGANFCEASGLKSEQLGSAHGVEKAILPVEQLGKDGIPENHNRDAFEKIEDDIKTGKIQEPIWWGDLFSCTDFF